MPKDTNHVKRIVYIGTQYDDKFIAKTLKEEGFRRLISVTFNKENQSVELSFSEELDYKPRKRVLQLSKKKHPDIVTEREIINFLAKEQTLQNWTILEAMEFPRKWLVFLTE